MALQTGRMSLVSLASEGARALARGEDQSLVTELIQERAMGFNLKVEYLDLSVCVELTKISKVAGILEFPVNERACARKAGL